MNVEKGCYPYDLMMMISILHGLFGNQGLCNATEYNYVPLKEEQNQESITYVGRCNLLLNVCEQ